jgi:hypothetical protein
MRKDSERDVREDNACMRVASRPEAPTIFFSMDYVLLS